MAKLAASMIFGFVVFASSAASAQVPPEFDAVFAIMTRDAAADSMGCRGCHVGPAEAPPAPYWGDTAVDVLASLEASGVLLGGRMSFFAYRLQQAEMPLGGTPWGQPELDTL